MGLVGNVVVFCCSWWIFFLMNVSRGFKQSTNHKLGCVKSAPESFSFKSKFLQTTKITLLFCFVFNLLTYFGCFEWILIS